MVNRMGGVQRDSGTKTSKLEKGRKKICALYRKEN